MRGINGAGPSQGSDAFLAGTRSRLNIQVDGRAASFNEITFGDLGLWDVQQVEIFRGAAEHAAGPQRDRRDDDLQDQRPDVHA